MEPSAEPATVSKALSARAWPEVLAYGALLALAGAAASYDWLRPGGPTPWPPVAVLALAVLLVVRVGVLRRRNRRAVASFAASDEFKTQLLRFISHEIANPLSPLKLQSDILRKGAPDPDKSWKVVDRSIGRLESLSRDVRLMALVETRRLVHSTVVADLVPRVAAAVQTYHGLAVQRRIQLRSDLAAAPLAVPIDGERFDQVVDNLLSNALKFTPPGGTVDVRLWRAPGGTAVLEMHDSGAGMTPEQQARLFSAFGRPSGSTTPGLGLGLYLCKAIVDGHGGRITATSEGAGKGATFRVELPVAPAGGPRSRTGPPSIYKPAMHRDADVPAGRPPDLPV